MPAPRIPRIASFRTPAALRAHLAEHRIPIAFDDELAPAGESPLAQPIVVDGVRVGNRFCVLPMEGWDGAADGAPSELTRRRWRRFGASGAKLVFGGEAMAVRHDGRASPNQLVLLPRTERAVAALREGLVASHRESFGSNADGDLFVGLQLTHSGRFAKPDAYDRPAPLSACRHPVLDDRLPDGPHVATDDQIERLIDDFVAAARLAHACGFQFVDVKQCHGYFGHELLGARTRPGPFGGPLENRFRFVRRIVERIHAEVPGLAIGVRLSAFDLVPYRRGADAVGEIERPDQKPEVGFGILAGDDLDAALADSRALLRLLEEIGVRWICVTAGSPYYCAHLQRPAYFPPSDGYLPPEDPLWSVARHIRATALLKASFPRLTFVGSGYTYLQDWLPHVAQFNVRTGLTDFVGLGRMMLSYPTLAADLLRGAPLDRGSICRTFSDCTTGPRIGEPSGCYPLDDFYTSRPVAKRILDMRTAASRR